MTADTQRKQDYESVFTQSGMAGTHIGGRDPNGNTHPIGTGTH